MSVGRSSVYTTVLNHVNFNVLRSAIHSNSPSVLTSVHSTVQFPTRVNVRVGVLFSVWQAIDQDLC